MCILTCFPDESKTKQRKVDQAAFQITIKEKVLIHLENSFNPRNVAKPHRKPQIVGKKEKSVPGQPLQEEREKVEPVLRVFLAEFYRAKHHSEALCPSEMPVPTPVFPTEGFLHVLRPFLNCCYHP